SAGIGSAGSEAARPNDENDCGDPGHGPTRQQPENAASDAADAAAFLDLWEENISWLARAAAYDRRVRS
ncbi:MAG: hypothetical protein AAGE13_13620, partial [Pseudomonadota bacterium]